jgi:hypothetical protein
MTTDDFLTTYSFVQDFRRQLPRHGERDWKTRQLDDLQGMVWHQTLTSSTAQAVASYHVGPNHIDSRGLPGISYTFFIGTSGTVMLCNDLEAITYSQGDRTKPGDENRRFVAACFGGNFDAPGYIGSDQVTIEQMQAALKLWEACRVEFGWHGQQLYGHYHFGKPKCPGTVLGNLVEAIRKTGGPRFERYTFDTVEGRQAALQAVGHYDGNIDGLWGIASRRALVAYQAAAGLTVDGIWGPETEQALRRDA